MRDAAPRDPWREPRGAARGRARDGRRRRAAGRGPSPTARSPRSSRRRAAARPGGRRGRPGPPACPRGRARRGRAPPRLRGHHVGKAGPAFDVHEVEAAPTASDRRRRRREVVRSGKRPPSDSGRQVKRIGFVRAITRAARSRSRTKSARISKRSATGASAAIRATTASVVSSVRLTAIAVLPPSSTKASPGIPGEACVRRPHPQGTRCGGGPLRAAATGASNGTRDASGTRPRHDRSEGPCGRGGSCVYRPRRKTLEELERLSRRLAGVAGAARRVEPEDGGEAQRGAEDPPGEHVGRPVDPGIEAERPTKTPTPSPRP